MITAKTKFAQKHEFKNDKKGLHHQFGAQMCSLYNMCHIEIDYNMNYKFMCDRCKNEIHSKTRVKESQQKEPRHQFRVQICPLYNYNMNHKFRRDH